MTHLQTKMAALAVGACILSATGGAQTGPPAIQPFEDFMTALMTKHKIPGGSIAVVRNGKLVMVRGYGMADRDNKIAAQPDSRYRIASESKLITSVAIMHLVEQGKLSVDQRAFELLTDLQAPGGSDKDPRLATITIDNLLTHTGGWDDSSSGFDPMFASSTIATALSAPSPVSTENIIRYMRGQMLDFDPGTKYRYSNFGYAVLGRIIERITGMSYEQYVRMNVLAPMGIAKMRIGNTLQQGQLPVEVAYETGEYGPSIYPDTGSNFVGAPYGQWSLECLDSHGGWISSVIDYAKFMTSIDGRRGKAFLNANSLAAMTARPAAQDWVGQSAWYGFGVMVRPVPTGQRWWHSGSLPGTTAYYIRTEDGIDFVVLFNWRPSTNGAIGGLSDDIDSGFWQAYSRVTSWPAVDYFVGLYPDTDPAAAAAGPAITTREGVLNAASFDRGIVPGSWGSVFGVNLSRTTRSWTGADFNGPALPLELEGVSVRVNGQPASIAYVSPRQINFQMPNGIDPGWVPLEVLNNGVSTGIVLTHVAANSPGVFIVPGGFAAAVNRTGTPVTSDFPAVPGDVISVYATGLVPSAAGSLTGSPQAVGNTTVSIGGKSAQVQYTGLVGPGLFQINVVVPEFSPGNQSIVITTNSVDSQKGVMLPIGTAR